MWEWRQKPHWEIKISWSGIWWIFFGQFPRTIAIRNQSKSYCLPDRKRFKLLTKTLALMLRSYIYKLLCRIDNIRKLAGIHVLRRRRETKAAAFLSTRLFNHQLHSKHCRLVKIHLPPCIKLCFVTIKKTGLSKVFFVKKSNSFALYYSKGNQIVLLPSKLLNLLDSVIGVAWGFVWIIDCIGFIFIRVIRILYFLVV